VLSCTLAAEVHLENEPTRHLRVAIAGSGFSGLGTAIKLKEKNEWVHSGFRADENE
jgi:NADH dehydrogenase FAD-containing subunit